MATAISARDTNTASAAGLHRCAHCGLPATDSGASDNEHRFCCNGCRTAWELIHDCGLDAFYRLQDQNSDESAWSPRQRRDDETDFEYLDDAGFQEKFVIGNGVESRRITLALEGIHCAACVWLLEKLPVMAAGVTSARVNWSRQTIELDWRPGDVALSQIARRIYDLGYTPFPVHASTTSRLRQEENRRQLVRLGVAAACAGNNMLLAAALYFGMFTQMAAEHLTLFRYYSALIGLIAVLGPARVFFRGAWSAIRTRTSHMDLPVSLGLALGTIQGVYNTLAGVGEVYFDSLSVLVFVLLLGRWLQFRQQGRAADSLELLFRMTPRFAKKWIDDRWVRVTTDQLMPGDRVRVLADELFPADGTIVAGKTMVDESLLSGESLPSSRAEGESVAAGTKNLEAAVEICVDAAGADTRIQRLVGLVEQAGQQRSRIVQWADRIGAWFVAIAIGLASIVAIYWGIFDDWSVGLDRSIALLIVACPCALALATPLAVSVALGRAARRRLMVKDGDVFERLAGRGRLWLDKTGTITEGRLEVRNWFGDSAWIAPVAALEKLVGSHPVATALVDYAKREVADHQLETLTVQDFRRSSNGVRGRVDGHDLAVGTIAALDDWGFDVGDVASSTTEALTNDEIGMRCYVGVDGRVVVHVQLADRIRPDATPTIGQLKRLGWKIGILSGDRQEVVSNVGRELGLDESECHGELSPEEKVEWVRRSSQNETTVVVGDGVNDSAALAAADVGIAVKSGAEASLEAAPVYLGQPGLTPLLSLLKLARSTRRTIVANLTVSLLYNVVAASSAAVGWINPLVAAIIMPISSLTVVGISLLPLGEIDRADTDEPNA